MMSSLAPARKGRSFFSHARNERLFFHQFFMLASVLTIFSVDVSTDSEISISALYVVVVLFSARLYAREHVIFISATCIALTLLSCTLNRRGEVNMGILNSAIGALLIGITSYLVLQIEAAKHATRLLTEANRLRDALIGSVSHELRTPLTTILGGASLLADSPAITKNPQLSSVANSIRDEASRLNGDIQNFLDAARITSNGLLARRDWTDANDIIAGAIKRSRASLAERQVEVTCARELPLLYLDPQLIEQALVQILSNAGNFSAPLSVIRVNASTEDQRLVITVTDKGAGLTVEEKTRITERFFRGGRHVGKVAGSGLGLWIASTFIMSNNGTFEAFSEGEGCGSTIRIAFPITESHDHQPAHFTGPATTLNDAILPT